jgi:hypothetical protein
MSTETDELALTQSNAGWIINHDGTGATNYNGYNFALAWNAGAVLSNGPSGHVNYVDTVWAFGFNIGTGGPHDIRNSTKPYSALHVETEFINSGVITTEVHWNHHATTDGVGVFHRPFAMQLPAFGSTGSSIAFAADYLSFQNWDNEEKLTFDYTVGNINLLDGMRFVRRAGNDIADLCINAAGSAFLDMPKIDSSDRLKIAQPIIQQGVMPASNVLVSFQAIGTAAAYSNLLSFNAAGVGFLYGINFVVSAPGELNNLSQNNDSSIGASVNELAVLAASSGDPKSRYKVIGGTSWVAGADNSDSDFFKISTFDFAPGRYDQFVVEPERIRLNRPPKLPTYKVAGAPSASAMGAGSLIYVGDERGGPTVAYSDGVVWRRIYDNDVIS